MRQCFDGIVFDLSICDLNHDATITRKAAHANLRSVRRVLKGLADRVLQSMGEALSIRDDFLCFRLEFQFQS